MKALRDIAAYRPLLSRAVFMLTGVLLLSACATQQQIGPAPPPLLLHQGTDVEVADVDLLAVSPAMNEFLERYILQYKNRQTRVHLLTTAVTSSGVLGFDYDASRSLSAQEAFNARAGNCIGFANMMVALARASGLRAGYQEVFRRPVWSSRGDTVLLMKHVNVVVEGTRMDYVMDVSGLDIHPSARRRLVDDNYAKALYLNNLGAEALLENDLPTAYAFMAKAIEIAPMVTDSWVNMGVVFGRNEQLDDAITVFKRALEIDPYQYSAMSNLYEVYVEQGNLEAASVLQRKVERYRKNNPYYLLHLSDEALAEKQFDESLDLLRRAIRKQNDDHMLYFAMARTQYLSGERAAAEDSLGRARELAPQKMVAWYRRPLDELVAEHQAQQDSLTP
ncbi:MAG: tetratricopeptide repeat protein [Gammaproteobacteria bacterium]|nr:tetratricopeptide repeat protein [Gammaproteobacteria bacterium]NNK99335.1 tetratricopeptide repeat protein [Xanthomonadales bacterium]